MYNLLKPLLFSLSPERAHHLTVRNWRSLLAIPAIGDLAKAHYRAPTTAATRVEAFGLEFPNAVGLAAGFDKDGKYLNEMAALGFGFLEVGTVTPKPQKGNPQPRLFRLPGDRALINRMGFNNEGVESLVRRLNDWRDRNGKNLLKNEPIIGGNIGKNKDTPNEDAVSDYKKCFKQLFPLVNYFVVNVSSPNTPNLRALQDKKPLYALLSELQSDNQGQSNPKPILLKISPDLSFPQLDDVLDIAEKTQLAGLIATNTTISRSGLRASDEKVNAMGKGGLSGAPLRQRSTEVVRYLHEHSHGKIPIIGVGGIDSPVAAQEKIDAGASLVQIYSGFIYAGPRLVRDIVEEIKL